MSGSGPIGAKVAVVTGGTRGIGRAVALRLRAEGWRVVTAARRPPVETDPDFVACDVADAASVRELFGTVAKQHGRLDALVSCAGLAGANSLEGDDTLWHEIIGSNLNGTYYCCKAALPLLPDGIGRIVNVASVLGLRGVPDQTAYCSAKHGVVGLTRALALAVAARGITVNALCPGWVDTDMAYARYRDLGITA